MLNTNDINKLDLNLLKVFEALYQERNMTTVAQSLFISPSAVSHAIKRLRGALNDELFVRQGSQMQPTPVCERLAPQLIEVLGQLRQVLQSCGEFDLPASTQTFRVALPDALEPIILPKLQQRMRVDAPLAKLHSVRLSRTDMNRQLTAKHIDAAVDIALPIKLPIEHLVLSSDHFCVVMDQHHPLVGCLDADNYLSCSHIAVSTRAMGKVLEDFALLAEGINRQIDVRCQNYFTAMQLLQGSELLLTAPSLIATQPINAERAADHGLVTLALPFDIPTMATHLYWHQSTNHDEALCWFREMLRGCFL